MSFLASDDKRLVHAAGATFDLFRKNMDFEHANAVLSEWINWYLDMLQVLGYSRRFADANLQFLADTLKRHVVPGEEKGGSDVY